MCTKKLDSVEFSPQDSSRYSDPPGSGTYAIPGPGGGASTRQADSSVRCRLRWSDQQSGDWTTTARYRDSLPTLEHRHPPTYRPAFKALDAALSPRARPRSGGSATVIRPRLRLRRSAHRSGDSPSMPWYRVSFGMLKHPPAGRVDSSRVSDAPPKMLSTARGFGDRWRPLHDPGFG